VVPPSGKIRLLSKANANWHNIAIVGKFPKCERREAVTSIETLPAVKSLQIDDKKQRFYEEY
jgi:hypothetical protein